MVFRFSKTGKLTVDELITAKTVHLTQFGCSIHELGIEFIFVKTPQDKGRIERFWVTLQCRLLIKFAKRKIRTLSEANRFLKTKYGELFNKKFFVTPQVSPIFAPLEKGADLDSILSVRHT